MPCCSEMCGILFVMYGSSVLSSVFLLREMICVCLYGVTIFHVFVGFWYLYDVY